MTKSSKWFLGILAILTLVSIGFVLFLVAVFSPSAERTETFTSGSGEKIGVVDLKGTIYSSDEVVRQMKKYRENRSIKAILLHVDSPGGAPVPSQEMYEEVRKTRDGGKPVIVSMGSVAASGGYYVACGASRLVANRATLTGSIGVVSEFLQFYEALNKLGIDIETIKAGKLKDAGSPSRAMTEADRKYFQSLMDEVHRQFISVVMAERKLGREDVMRLADGRVFTGEQAVKLGLVDTLGTFEDAVRIAASMVGITGEPALVKERKRKTWFESMFGDVEETVRDLKQHIVDSPALSYRWVSP